MSDELLRAAAQALKEETNEGDSEGRFTRARVMASLHQGTVRRRTRLAFVLPIAACLAAGTAWGSATGKLPVLWQSIARSIGFTSQRKVPVTPASSPLVAPGRAIAPVPIAPAPAQAPMNDPAPLEDLGPGPAQALPKPSAAPLASSDASIADRDGDLYRLAHEAHFAQHDYARALAGWEAYLSATPNGRFAREARYNRAICLVRLGRDAEARLALEPFAAGRAGYRQKEARQLLEELAR